MKSKFFVQKFSDLGSVLKKLMQTKRITNESIVTKYIVTVDGDVCDFAAKKSNF